MSYLRVWGCNAYVTRDSSDKLDPGGNKVVFIGYPITISYYFDNPTEKQVFIKRRATFLEKELLSHGIGENHVDLEEIREPLVTEPVVRTSPKGLMKQQKHRVFVEVPGIVMNQIGISGYMKMMTS